MFTILFKAHVHSLFKFQNCSVISFGQYFGPIVQFHLATGTPDCWGNLVKGVWEFCSSRLKSSTTSSNTEDLPGDFLLSTLPVRTNLLIKLETGNENEVNRISKLLQIDSEFIQIMPITGISLHSVPDSVQKMNVIIVGRSSPKRPEISLSEN